MQYNMQIIHTLYRLRARPPACVCMCMRACVGAFARMCVCVYSVCLYVLVINLSNINHNVYSIGTKAQFQTIDRTHARIYGYRT